MEAAPSGSLRRPLLPELLQICTRTQLAECLRKASVTPGNVNKAKLEEICSQKCEDPRVHEAVCRTLLGHLSSSSLKEWLLHLRRLGHNVEPSTLWGGFSKEVLVAAYLRMDQPSRAAQQPVGEPQCQTSVETTLVPFDPSVGPRLQEKWIRRARRRLRREDRKQVSHRVIAALKKVLPTCIDTTVKDVRALVSSMTGIELDEGARRLFFDSQLLKLTRRAPTRKPKRCKPLFDLKVGRRAPS